MSRGRAARGTQCPHVSPHRGLLAKQLMERCSKKWLHLCLYLEQGGEGRPGTSGGFGLDVLLQTQQGVGTLGGRGGAK